jgi:hypothetical protein
VHRPKLAANICACLYFGEQNLEDEFNCGVMLDADVKNGKGPETMTINSQSGRTYIFYVHNYSQEILLSSSQASLKVLGVPGLTEPIMIPSGACNADQIYWEVFRMIDGRVTVVNKIVQNEPLLL